MGFRFRKSVKIAPGIRLTASKRGVGMRLGGRKGGVSIGPSGARVRASIPGTGISYSDKVGGGKTARSRTSPNRSEPVAVQVRIHVDEDTGDVSYTEQNGGPLPPAVEREVKRAAKAEVLDLLEKTAMRINADVEGLAELHLLTPDPRVPPSFIPVPHSEPRPKPPQQLPRRGVLGFLVPPIGRRREQQAQRLLEEFTTATKRWEHAQQAHKAREDARLARFDAAQDGDTEAMEGLLRERLETMTWPYETIVTFDLIDSKTLALDVDLPEIEDIPVKECAVAARGNKLNIKQLSDKRKRTLYLAHVHAIGFRLLGEAFAVLPGIQSIIISAYSQRVDSATGHEGDDYLFSANVSRDLYCQANFASLADLDPIVALDRFDLRRNVTKTGIIRPVEPFDPYQIAGSPRNAMAQID